MTATGQVNAIQTALGALITGNINNNTVTNISSSGAANPVFCIIDSGFGTTTTNVFKNKIGNIQSDNAGGTVTGILVQTGTTTQNVYDNLVGDLRTPSSTLAASNQLRGIDIGSGPY